MRISALARLSGTTIPAIRSYESAGLLDCGRLKAGFRDFGEGALEQVRLILACRSLKWTFAEIRNLMDQLKLPQHERSLPQLSDLAEQLRRLKLLQTRMATGSLAPLPVEEDRLLKIGQLAEQTGLTRGTLDSLVNSDLLPCVRRPSGYRDFPPSSIEQVDLILALRSLGYTIAQTRTSMSGPLTLPLQTELSALIDQRRSSLIRLNEILQEADSSEGL